MVRTSLVRRVYLGHGVKGSKSIFSNMIFLGRLHMAAGISLFYSKKLDQGAQSCESPTMF